MRKAWEALGTLGWVAFFLLVASEIFGQATVRKVNTTVIEVSTDQGVVTAIYSGRDRIAVKYNGASKVIKVEHISQAGDIDKQLAALVLMAEDGMVSLKQWKREDHENSPWAYWVKANKAYTDLRKVLPDRMILLLAQKLRRY